MNVIVIYYLIAQLLSFSLTAVSLSPKISSKLKNLLQQNKANLKTKSSASSTAAAPKAKNFNFRVDFSFSLSSMLTGVALSGAGYYYLESQDLNRKLIKSQLLSGEIEGKEFLSKIKNDWKLFEEALERRNESFCILIIESKEIIEDPNGDLLMRLIDKKMSRVIDYILSLTPEKRIHVQLDSVDSKTGRTPLLAALQSKMYVQAHKLLKIGAKPLIPATPEYPPRGINDFLKELDASDPASEEFLKDFNEIYRIVR